MLPAGVCADWLARIDRRYHALRDAIADPEFSVHDSSLRLRAIDGLPLDTVLHEALSGEAGQAVRSRFGDGASCLADQCWVRRQYPPHVAPPLHAAHAWHQDGALHVDFVRLAAHVADPDGDADSDPDLDGDADADGGANANANANADSAAGAEANADPGVAATQPPCDAALLDMLTLWIALTPCGVDAPGIECLSRPLTRLLRPAELSDACVRDAFAGDTFVRPAMAPGDALLLHGGDLHRTFVDAGMTRVRTSIELRFVGSPVAPRLLCERRVNLPAASNGTAPAR